MRRYRFPLAVVALSALFAGLSFGQGPLTNALNLMVRTTTNGSLYVYGVTAGAQGPLTNLGNAMLRTWGSNAALGVTLASGSSWTCTQDAIATTSTDCFIATNTTAATGALTVQMSPRLRFRGTAWDTAASETVDFFEENLPATAATPTGTLKWGYSLNGAAATYPLTLTSAGQLSALTGVTVAGATGVSGTCDTPTFTGGVATTCGGAGGSVDGTYFVTSNFTTAANTNLQTITGLTWTFPANTAINVPFRCSLVYSQATAAVADSIGIQDVTVAPTNGMFASTAETTLTAVAFGDLTAFSSTTATAVNTFTPGAIGTTYNIELNGLIEQPSNASTSAFNVMIKTSASADAITIYRGSYCKVG